MKTKSGANLILIVALALSVNAQQRETAYQNRGRYNEGTRTNPSNGPAGLDLIAALVDYDELSKSLPANFHAQFFLPNNEPVYLTIREIKPEYWYWLDEVKPGSPWRPAAQNSFEWPTATVIRSLNWGTAALTLDRLGATVRVGRLNPGGVEQVLPVALFASRAPAVVDGYRFVFWPAYQMRLKFQVFKAENASPFDQAQEFKSVLAEQPLAVTWKAREWQDGWYRLVVSGYTLSNNARVDKIIRFYHSRTM